MYNPPPRARAPHPRLSCVAVGTSIPICTNKVVFVDYMTITASGGGSFAATTLTPSPTGVCTFVDTVTGVEKEDMQDRNSVRVRNILIQPPAGKENNYFCSVLFACLLCVGPG